MSLHMKGQVEDFKPFIPLIQGLRNPGMRIRHWDRLSKDLGFSVQPKVGVSVFILFYERLFYSTGINLKIAKNCVESNQPVRFMLKHCYRCGRLGVRFPGRPNWTQCRQRLATAATLLGTV